MDIPDSKWSGGFMLDKDSSFHINIRSTYSYSAFIRCQVTLRGATYDVILSDAASYPPPFRLENLSQTPLTCYQKGVRSLAIPLNPGQSVPYSWDEHTLPEQLCVSVKGGKELKVDLEEFGPKGKVFYESYFYIMAYSTFSDM
jgi:vacuolar protein sorting-associated protein 13D